MGGHRLTSSTEQAMPPHGAGVNDDTRAACGVSAQRNGALRPLEGKQKVKGPFKRSRCLILEMGTDYFSTLPGKP